MTEEQLKKGAELKALIEDTINHQAMVGEFKKVFEKDVSSLFISAQNDAEAGIPDRKYFYPRGQYIDMETFVADYMQNVAKHISDLQKQFDEL